MSRSLTIASNLVIVMIVGYLLIVGRSVLVPIVLAIFVWNILNSIQVLITRMPVLGKRLPKPLSMLLSFVVVLGFVMVVANILENNLGDVMQASSRYQSNFKRMLSHIDQQRVVKIIQSVQTFLNELDLRDLFLRFYSVFTSVASSAVLIALYVAFLFIEQEVFPQKITNLFPRAKSKELVIHVFQRITHDIQAYLGLKTLLGLTTSLLSWLIMRYVGLDFSDFWALLIFLLNYIPNIGAIIATFFPAMLALIQFSEPWTAGMVILGLVLIQFVMGNIVEPRFLSRSLNLSALVILMALALWGAIWGVLGMFLSVPITVMMMIIFSQFSATRPIAILLSQNGSIQQMEDDAR